MERALKDILIETTGLKVYPSHAPKNEPGDYIVYIGNNYTRLKELQGYMDNKEKSILINVLCNSYSTMKSYLNSLEERLVILPGQTIRNIYFEDITINDISESYENELQKERGILNITIHYKEV